MPVHVFALLRRTNDESDCIKTSILLNLKSRHLVKFLNKTILIDNIYLESFILQQKCDFLKRGYLCSDFACAKGRRPFELE